MRGGVLLLAGLLVGCTPAQWVAAGQVAGGALDGAAVARADQIRSLARQAEDAARQGDTEAAMASLNTALVVLASETYRDLKECRSAPPPAARPPAPAAPSVSATAAPVTPPPAQSGQP